MTATTEDRDAEERIFQAARDVFHESGFAGARMKEIARRADINHSMLHYYYRTKGRLFDAVFERAAGEFFPPIVRLLEADLPLLQKIDGFVDAYLDALLANPHMPGFVLLELRRNPGALRKLAGRMSAGVAERLQRDMTAAGLREMKPADLLTNVVGLCVFPFIARPMIQTAFKMEDEDYAGFLRSRKEAVKAFIHSGLS